MELFRHLKIRNWTGNIINNVKQKNFKYLKSNPKTNINRTTNKLCKAKRKKIKRAIYSVICSCLKTRKQKGHSTKIDQTMSCWEWHTTKRNLNSFKGNWINKKDRSMVCQNQARTQLPSYPRSRPSLPKWTRENIQTD